MTVMVGDLQDFVSDDLTDAQSAGIGYLLGQWRSHWAKNRQRTLYADTEQAFKDIGIAMPDQLKRMNYVLGWSSQAVSKPAKRTQFQGVTLADDDDPLGLSEVFARSGFESVFSQAVQSANLHGMALLSVMVDDAGDTRVVGHSAESSAAVWDHRKGRLSSALTVNDADEAGRPSRLTAFFPGAVVECWREGEVWRARPHPTNWDRIPVVAVANDPQLTSPLGRSRLTNAAMALNDMAVRTLARMEANAEFYSSPQIAVLGADYEAFFGDDAMSQSEKFRLAMDRLLAITKDEDGDKPELKQLTQATMTPHSDMLRSLAMSFAGETGLPPASLGVVHDQPASAEAIRAAEHDLLVDVTFQNAHGYTRAIRELSGIVAMVRDNLKSPPEEAARLGVRFADPEFRSLSAEADAITKLGPVMPLLSNYPVLLERLFDREQIERIQADNRRSSVSDLMSKLTEKADGQSERAVEATEATVPETEGTE